MAVLRHKHILSTTPLIGIQYSVQFAVTHLFSFTPFVTCCLRDVVYASVWEQECSRRATRAPARCIGTIRAGWATPRLKRTWPAQPLSQPAQSRIKSCPRRARTYSTLLRFPLHSFYHFIVIVGTSAAAEAAVQQTDEPLLPFFPSTLCGPLLFVPQDNLNRDGIYPGKYTYQDDLTLKTGVILVASYNFGTGPSCEQAATLLKAASCCSFSWAPLVTPLSGTRSTTASIGDFCLYHVYCPHSSQ
jgi:hypothetical protein